MTSFNYGAPMAGKVDAWGRVSLDPEEAFRLAYAGVDIWTLATNPSDEIERYNALCTRFDKDNYRLDPPTVPTNTPEEEHNHRASNWLISDEIKSIDVREFLLELCRRDDERDRINLEMDLYESRDLIPLLQLMMYLVDHFRSNKIVWGVGRGSSVASYVLYLIGIHKIDSIKYDLSIHDFLK
jgi:DNA polymerase III alpha subunit